MNCVRTQSTFTTLKIKFQSFYDLNQEFVTVVTTLRFFHVSTTTCFIESLPTWNRTHTNGFGGHNSTIKLSIYYQYMGGVTGVRFRNATLQGLRIANFTMTPSLLRFLYSTPNGIQTHNVSLEERCHIQFNDGCVN